MFDPKTLQEEDSFAFDFTDLLATGETITSALITIDVISGVDANPSAMIAGSPTIAGAFVSVKLIGGVEGVLYCIHCLATCSTGLKKELKGDLRVRADC
jgi:hypothetical protein